MSDYANDDFFEAMLRQAIIKNNNNEIAAIPSDEELKKTYVFSERHNKKMKKLFSADKRREVFTIVYRWGKVAAAVVCVTATLTFGVLLTSAEVRKIVSDVIVTWFEQFTNFQSEEVSDEFIEREWVLNYLPEGFSLNDEFESVTSKYFEYVDANGVIIDFSYAPSDGSVSVDNEDKEYEIKIENGIVYHLFESTLSDNEHDFNIIVWDMSGYRFKVAGNYDINELLNVSLSVK